MNDFIVEVTQKPGSIVCNFDEIETALKNQMQAYADLEVTEDNIPERKKDIATLRKIKDAVDSKRKEVKKTFSEPLTEFETKVKNLTGILDTEIIRIDRQIKEFDHKRIEEKQKHIQELYDQNVGEFAEYLPLSAIKSSKWDNKTCSDNEIISDIQMAKIKVMGDIQAIKALGSEIEDKLLATYKANGNVLATAVQKNTEYLEAKKAAEERLRAEAERKAQEEARRAQEEAQMAAELVKKTEPVVESKDEYPFPEQFETEPVIVIRVTGHENIDALRTFLDMSEIPYEEVQA